MMAGASAQPSAGALVTGIPGAPYVEKENSPLRSPSPVKRGKQSSQQQPRDEQQPTGSLGILAAIGRGTFRQRPAEVVPDIDEEFDRLLNTLEVPESLRSKLLSMSKSVKESMVRGQTLIPTPRSRSGSMSAAMFSSSEAITPAISAGPSRSGSSSTIALPPRGASTKEVPEYFATHLKANDASRVDVARVRRLRVLLGSESPAWASEFIEHQGLAALCRRMQELIDMEWREEQHDDLLLHEILRCLSVLSKTDRGKVELAAQIPQPFAALVDLAFSEKKPGDLGTRKIIFDLVTNLFSMGIVPAESNRKGLVEVQTRRHLGRCTQKVCSTTPQERVRYRQGPVFPGPSGSSSNSAAGESADWTLSFVLALLSNPRTPESDAMLDFISASHTPRPFKTYLLEVSGVCRDYFWIFCHAQNRFWDLSSVNVDDVESPKVPGGATGSVEFEAMAYLTCHLRLLNVLGSILVERHAFAALSDGTSAAYDFYNELFFSGMERILSVLRKSSQVYYQPTHLELARFFHLAARARFGVPPGLAVWQNRPLQLHA
ncbi:hypothetical protein OC834_003443 [Tilletia horrida]|uniref:Formin GTPase-binding domain-containing protein n=1 Tax=Tilletia horrida TaxID=155126 RepID=A0AAN6JJC8_9BASI|nr:hypothetical protein OC842_004631 [Tilletia horrida]KAK0530055.1 hypothetical protein OC834_003443 [Tilletia horrida]KAK0551070.1 hypothetical protein OC844_006631 [Tilletia horrida]